MELTAYSNMRRQTERIKGKHAREGNFNKFTRFQFAH